MLPAWVDDDLGMGLLAFYEMIWGDVSHAKEIYSRLLAAPGNPPYAADFRPGDQTLYWRGTLQWGMLGAVNLAHLNTINGDTASAKDLLQNARAYLQIRNHRSVRNGRHYVRAQIAAVEGDHNTAIDSFRKAVDGGWPKAWVARIDPIMAELRKDARFMQILEELEAKLLNMRENPMTLASSGSGTL